MDDERLFRDLIGEGKVTIYLDDILIFSKDRGEHRQIIKRVLQRLRENKLFLKAEKCEFEVLEMEYLGVIISENSIRMDPVKICRHCRMADAHEEKGTSVVPWIHKLLSKFIKNYSKVVKALTQLTGLTAWMWGKPQEDAFKELKRRMAEDVILAIPNDDDPFRVEADASEGASAPFSVSNRMEVWRPVAFMSKSLSVTEQNYEIYDKELLAIMLALSEWRHYLMGAAKDVEIWTDHQNLQYYRLPQKLNRRQARWVTELAEYHFVLRHKPGVLNKKADLLSRREPTMIKARKTITTLSSSNQRTSSTHHAYNRLCTPTDRRSDPTRGPMGRWHWPPPSPTTAEYPERKGCSTTMGAYTYHEKPLSEARSFPEATITLPPVIQESTKPRS